MSSSPFTPASFSPSLWRGAYALAGPWDAWNSGAGKAGVIKHHPPPAFGCIPTAHAHMHTLSWSWRLLPGQKTKTAALPGTQSCHMHARKKDTHIQRESVVAALAEDSHHRLFLSFQRRRVVHWGGRYRTVQGRDCAREVSGRDLTAGMGRGVRERGRESGV